MLHVCSKLALIPPHTPCPRLAELTNDLPPRHDPSCHVASTYCTPLHGLTLFPFLLTPHVSLPETALADVTPLRHVIRRAPDADRLLS
jgi:hypothetical protein